MDLIKKELEYALNNTHPMRGLSQGWCYAGNFFIDKKKYAFYGTNMDNKVTCRCMENENYANHWFEMKVDYISDKRIITVGECVG